MSLTATVSPTEISIASESQPVLTHRLQAPRRPAIHPLIAPDGVGVLTEDSPAHHPWQCGIYTGFNLVNGIGFWRDEPGDGTFRPVLDGDPVVAGDSVSWIVRNDWVSPSDSTLVEERQGWRLQHLGDHYLLDLNWDLQAVEDLEIGQFMAGGLFVRMPWRAETGGAVLNSEGLKDSDAEKQRARWTAVSMPIPDRTDWAGIAILDHPNNPAHPVTWRVDNELGISPSRCIAESWKIAAGDTERYAFRMYIFTGHTHADVIDQSWRDFAHT